MISIVVNGQKIEAPEVKSILEVSLGTGIYIPHLCYHPATGPHRSVAPQPSIYHNPARIDNGSQAGFSGCNLCLVEIEGFGEPVKSCQTPISDGIVVRTDTAALKAARKRNLSLLVQSREHPTACIACNLSEGCDRKICSMGIGEEDRCCWKFHACEFRELALHTGIDVGVNHGPAELCVPEEHPLLAMNYSLCVGCLRCVTACSELAKRGALGYVNKDGRIFVGPVGRDLKQSGCKFCMACAEVCPTGAIRQVSEKVKKRAGLPPSVFPPKQHAWKSLSQQNLVDVPEKEGVFRLCDKHMVIIQISGTANLKDELEKELKRAGEPLSFCYEVAPMFMMRERQMIQQHLNRFGELPVRAGELDDLF